MNKNEDERITPTQELSEVFLIEEALERHGGGRFLLVGENGNAFSIMGRVARALRKAGWSERAVEKVLSEMRASTYNHLLRVAMRVQHPRALAAESLRCEAEELMERAREMMERAVDDMEEE